MSIGNQGATLRVTSAAPVYGDTELVRDANLSAAPGELLALLGPPGSGKTSLPRTTTGFLPLTMDEIRFDGVRVNEFPVEEGQLGMVFQRHRLFPALTVYRNLETCLTGTVTTCITAAGVTTRTAELLPVLGLTGLEAYFPAELSDGQQRHAAPARALLVRSRSLLLNEPFTGPDAPFRRELMELLRREQRSHRLTMVFVTHDEEDAAWIVDSIVRSCDTAGTRSFRQVPLQRF